ncbi:hypothetical protein SAMN05216337_105328 [Bradyrhizobium brasilense]|uniref:Uncharacterized protein n=1 Tax=Bradyrhizobium brasilense TaxID=1419277 RepID=A0A1G7KLE6_9BRAD|nr:hypothetical protein SAMN05216337_105328 [Bradyrhizobium brasilense]
MRWMSGQSFRFFASMSCQKRCDGVTGKPLPAYSIGRSNSDAQLCFPAQDLRLKSNAWSQTSTVVAAVSADPGPRIGTEPL